MKNTYTPLVDEHLQSVSGMTETGTDEFFYTRLRARMEKRQEEKNNLLRFGFGWRPAMVLACLFFLLLINGFMLSKQFQVKTNNPSSDISPLQSFAESYDQSISTSY